MRGTGAKVTQLLLENEVTLSQLYRVYAEQFPSHKSFWLALADDELKHASWIRKLGEGVDGGTVYLDEDRFKTRPIEIMQGYANDQMIRAQEEGMTLLEALSTAVDVEQSLLERSYFEVFETDSVEVKHLLVELKNAASEHLQNVRKAWEAAKQDM